MVNKKLTDITGTIILFIGFALAFLPHAAHSAIGLSDKTPHLKHVIYGIIIAVIGLAILICNNKALKVSSFK